MTDAEPYKTLREVRKESEIFAVYVGYPLLWCIHTSTDTDDLPENAPQLDFPAIALHKPDGTP